jgi:AcrR family transcriptional regulator
MARTLDPVAHAVRRDAFLDAAQRLIQTKGYERLSIQDVLDEVSVSKGAFYHYFGSKAALLDGVISRMVETATAAMAPAIADPQRSAVQKFDAAFSGLASFKAERKELILAVLRVWLSDENVVVRERFRRGVIVRMTPLLAEIIRQGVAEGSFHTASPEHTARVFVALLMGANEAAVDLFAGRQTNTVSYVEVDRTLAAFGDAFEQILGASPGALGFADRTGVIRDWFDAAAPVASGPAQDAVPADAVPAGVITAESVQGDAA